MFFSKASLAKEGLALPLVFAITCPTRNCKAFLFPFLKSSTTFALEAKTSLAALSISPLSVIWESSLFLRIWEGSFPVANISFKISFAVLLDMISL